MMAHHFKTGVLIMAWSGLCLAPCAAPADKALYPVRVGGKTFVLGQKLGSQDWFKVGFLGLYGGGSIDTTELDSSTHDQLTVLTSSPVGDSATLLAGRKQVPGMGNDYLWVQKINREGKTIFNKTYWLAYRLDNILVREKDGAIHVLCRAAFVDDDYEPVRGGTWHFQLAGDGKVLTSSIIIPGDSIRVHGFDFHQGGFLLWGREVTNDQFGDGETSESKLMLFDGSWRLQMDKTYRFGAREEIDHVSLRQGGPLLFGQSWDEHGRGDFIAARLDGAFNASPEKRQGTARYKPRYVAFSETGNTVRAHLLVFHSTFVGDMFIYDSTGFYDVAFDGEGDVATEKYYSVSKEYGEQEFAELGPDRWLFIDYNGKYREVSGGVPMVSLLRAPSRHRAAPSLSTRLFSNFDFLGRQLPRKTAK